jgi:hypothetical protein
MKLKNNLNKEEVSLEKEALINLRIKAKKLLLLIRATQALLKVRPKRDRKNQIDILSFN